MASSGSPLRLDGFDYRRVEVGGVGIQCAVGGSGPPVVLLHGYPQTHVMWRDVAASLAQERTVVLTDLRGYGDSDKPVALADDTTYSKRSMASDVVGVVDGLGLARFDVVGHDRGARVGHRLALDHPDRVTRLAVLDIVPTRHVLLNADRTMAAAYFHWFFLPVGDGIPEHLIGLDPEFWLRSSVTRLLAGGQPLAEDVMREYVRCFSEPAAIAATCADYRSALSVDLADDETSFAAGAVVGCPTLVLWGERGFVGRAYQPLEVWASYAPDVRGRSLPTGHFLPEEAPEQTLAELRAFLAEQ